MYTSELQLKVNCRKKILLSAQILYYNSLSAPIHLYMILAWPNSGSLFDNEHMISYIPIY